MLGQTGREEWAPVWKQPDNKDASGLSEERKEPSIGHSSIKTASMFLRRAHETRFRGAYPPATCPLEHCELQSHCRKEVLRVTGYGTPTGLT